MSQLSEVHQKLTEAEKAFIPTITYLDWWRTDEDTPRGIVGPLVAKGILDRANGLCGKIYRLTPLGQSVAAALRALPCTCPHDASNRRIPGKIDCPQHGQDEPPVDRAGLTDVLPMAIAKALYGENFDPFANPEAFDFCEKVSAAAIAELQS